MRRRRGHRVVDRTEATDELGEIVGTVAPPLRVQEGDERLVHLAGVLEAIRGFRSR